MSISAAQVKELRDLTGAGMMDCKAALAETSGDMEAAVDWLRAKGIAKADKKAGRVAAEGLIGVEAGVREAAIVEVNSETDFVARNDAFQAIVANVAKVALAYGYTLLAPYFELDPTSPAFGQTGYLPHPAGRPGAHPVAPVGGYMLGIPANIAPELRDEAVEALVAFTSPEAQKLYVLNGSRTAPRYSVGSDPEVRRMSSIFEAVDAMSWRDELQFWPRPPVPEISEIIQICGEELHDMLRGLTTPKVALEKAQKRADQIMQKRTSS